MCEVLGSIPEPKEKKKISQEHKLKESITAKLKLPSSWAKPAWANSSQELILKKTHHKKWPVKWLKAKALSSSPSTAKKKPAK
jgi:hypothetical protein